MGLGHSPSVDSHSDLDSFGDHTTAEADLDWPFGHVPSLDDDDLREAAYELFFTSCRSYPGFGGRNPLSFYPSHDTSSSSSSYCSNNGGDGEKSSHPVNKGGQLQVGKSRVKRSLGLKVRSARRRTTRFTPPAGTSPSVGPNSPARFRRPLTSAEIMRRQMKVSQQSDQRLRKTLLMALVGQVGKRAETIVLPLELLRQLKPSEFGDMNEYHLWQKRQLKLLEGGLLLHPSIPLEKSNASAAPLRELIRSADLKPLDLTKNSEAARALTTHALSLACRDNSAPDICHWADGFPLNLHLYVALLQSIFDVRDETVVIDEVDELLELMKKTWTILSINREMHNVCLTWVLFQQFVITGSTESDLLCAATRLLGELGSEGNRGDRDPNYSRTLSATLASMQGWAERRLLDYHDSFENSTETVMENVLALALSAAKAMEGEVSGVMGRDSFVEKESMVSWSQVDRYIRSSLRNAFNMILEGSQKTALTTSMAEGEVGDMLVNLAVQTEELARKERQTFSTILKQWHPFAAGVAAATLHGCYGVILRRYLAGVATPSHECVRVLQAAGRLETALVEIVVEDSEDCEDGGKEIVREMTPYEAEVVLRTLVKNWTDNRIKIAKDCFHRAKDTENWRPKSKLETHAQSAADLMKVAQTAVDEFLAMPLAVHEDLVQDLAHRLEAIIREYISFVATCGTKQSFIPPLPPLTRCNQDSIFRRMWRKVARPCSRAIPEIPSPRSSPSSSHHHSDDHKLLLPTNKKNKDEKEHKRASTSRGTQRLYVRLNTLYFLMDCLHALDKSLSFSPLHTTPRRRHHRRFFDSSRSAALSAVIHVAEVAAYRLIFLDSATTFYEGLYSPSVASARIRPFLRALRHNLSFLLSVIADRAHPIAVKEVMKASFEGFLMILLAGGGRRAFARSDYQMVAEDFHCLKRAFASRGEGLVSEEVVEKEAEMANGVVALMNLPTEVLVEEFSVTACEANGLGGSVDQKVPMPPTTGRWIRTDPNTILRVLCHRDDMLADRFLKKNFQLPKRR